MRRVTSLLILACTTALWALDAPSGVIALPEPAPADRPRVSRFGGSAVVIAPGQALTLIEALPDDGADPVVVVGGRRLSARILRRGEATQTVLLGFDLPPSSACIPVPLADSALVRVGDVVWTVGNSFGVLEQDGVAALSRGIVSGLYTIPADAPPARGRAGRVLTAYRGPVLETDAAINDGNQGGALLDDDGRLVGLVSLGLARERRLGTVVPLHLVLADLGLPAAKTAPSGRTDPIAGALAAHAADLVPSVALVYFERPAGLGNPPGMPRPAPISDDLPGYERERLEANWDRYYHEQQVLYTDQPVSALVIGRDLLLTAASNLHGDAKRGRVLLDGAPIDCTVVAVHVPLDLALLRAAKPLPLPPAVLAEQPGLACGDAIAVIGRHRAAAGHTVAAGVVSAIDRRQEQAEFGFHQTDAMANYGNLGGPVIDAAGAVVGLVVKLGPNDDWPWLINSGVALFVDSATVRQVLPQLMAGKGVTSMRTVGMGVRMQPDKASGMLEIKEVVPGTGAAAVGVMPGDLLVRLDGVAVTRIIDVTRLLVRHRIGDRIEVVLRRLGEETTLVVELKPFGDEKDEE